MKNPKTIYVVTSGEYSSYGIAAVFDNIEMAEEYIAKFGRSLDRPIIEEYDLNPDIALLRKGYQPYEVEMLRNGDVRRINSSNDAPRGPDGPYTNSFRQPIPHFMRAFVLARDEKHAVKIANEQRAQMIALGQWPEDKP